MKLEITIFIIFTLLSCKSPADELNENIKTSIFIKGTEIEENYNKYQNDITNSGFTTLLSLARIEKDKNHKESKKIIKKAKFILTNFYKKEQSLISDINNLLDSIQPSNNINLKEIEQLKIQVKESNKAIISNYKSDSTTIAISAQIIELIEVDCKYDIINNEIIFYDQKCVDYYNFLNLSLESQIIMSKLEVSEWKLKKYKH